MLLVFPYFSFAPLSNALGKGEDGTEGKEREGNIPLTFSISLKWKARNMKK